MGLVKMNKALSDDEFLTYSSSNGNQIIISNFASTQYECQGSCSCSSEKTRRISTPFTRSLFLAISATTSFLAIKIAEKSFHDQCLLHFSSSCDEESIHSSVTSCSEEEEEEEFAEYFCEGYCIPQKLNNQNAIDAQNEFLKEIGGCETFQTSGRVKVKRTITRSSYTVTYFRKRTRDYIEHSSKYSHMYTIARHKFSREHLTSFCKNLSYRSYWYSYPKSNKKNRRNTFMCVSSGNPSDFPDSRLDFLYQNIKCSMQKKNMKNT